MPRTTERQDITEDVIHLITLFKFCDMKAELDTLLESSDEESSGCESSSDDDELIKSNPSNALLTYLQLIHSQWYLHERVRIPKSSSQLSLLLYVYRNDRPELFRSAFRLNPSTFDALASAISPFPIFNNQSTNDQLPLDWQLGIALFRLGHHGNAASVSKIALYLGVGFGTVDLCTRRVIHAVCSDEFRQAAIQWPSEVQKEQSKAWVEEHSCPAWRNGWLMVDGSLVPLFSRPGFYGNNWFDRKSNYSLNVQVSKIIFSNYVLIFI